MLLKPVDVETGSVSGFDRGLLWNAIVGMLGFYVSILEELTIGALMTAQAALFGWCFGLLLCFVWWFSLLWNFAASICSARFSPNSLWSPLATLASCNFIYCILAEERLFDASVMFLFGLFDFFDFFNVTDSADAGYMCLDRCLLRL